MTEPLLDVMERRFGAGADPDSDGGRILGALTPRAPFDDQALTGDADLLPLTLVPTSTGVTVRAAGDADPLVLSLPAGPFQFRIVPPAGGAAARVEVTLVALVVPAPFLRPARVTAEETLEATAGAVELHLPDLLLVVTVGPQASARLAPAAGAGGALTVTMIPPTALVGPGTVVGFGFQSASLDLEAATGPEISVPEVELYVAPPGIAALAMHGGGHDLRIGLGPGEGLSGSFQLATADGAAAAARPRFLEAMAARLNLDRGAITLLELSGRIDVSGEVAARVGPLGDATSKLDYTLGLTLDDGWRASLTLAAGDGGDYLWRTRQPAPGGHDPARDLLGAFAVFTPLLASSLPTGSGYVDLALGAGVAATLAGSEAVSTQAVTLQGAELVLDDPQSGASAALLMLDLETELNLAVKVGGVVLISTSGPVKVRHRAIGLRLDFGPDGGAPRLKPVFDPAQGFNLDLADPGMFEVPEPLGDFIQPEGARVARQNPVSLDIDLGLKADLGIVTVERSSVRIPLDPPGAPTITALGARIDVPGALSGGGYLRLEPGGGFEGSLDATLAPPIGVRAAAGLAIQHHGGVDSVLATIDLELPVSIPLGTTGLGLFGFLGLLGVNFERKQQPGQTALDWFVGDAHGDATTLAAWGPAANHWALGLGAVIGTLEGGFIFNAKGMVVVELPGPRVLLVMKASILSPRAPVKGAPAAGALLAVIEISSRSVTIGVVAEYAAKPLLELRAPAEAFFNFDDPSDWHLDVGALPPKLPVSVKFLSSVRADGYLMLHGNGILEFPPHPLSGFSVAAGVHAALTWGPEPIGLYLRISAAADVGISFKPMLIVGTLALRGELHLFIVSIEASADATVLIAENAFFISAHVRGSVDFFFFEVSGCVTLELGTQPSSLPDPDPLVRALSLHNRSRPVLHGTASDGPVDGSLGDAARVEGGVAAGELPVVPIDAIPVLQLEMRPVVESTCTLLGRSVPSKLAPGAWLRRGERFYRYTLSSIELSVVGSDGAHPASPVEPGETPSVWWDRYGRPSGGDDNDVQLALLSWTPDPTPVAAERTTSLDERVSARWGDICADVALPTPLLWAFHNASEGPSPAGWALASTALPDPPGSVRSSSASFTSLHVSEPWRSGDALGDALAQLRPAYVFGNAAHGEEDPGGGHLLVAPRTGAALTPSVPGDKEFQKLFEALLPGPRDLLGDALRFDAGGMLSARILLFVNGRLLDGNLVLRPLDAHGERTGPDTEVDPQLARPVLSDDDLPREWTDPGGPWQPILAAAEAAFARFRHSAQESLSLLLLTADLPGGTTQIELGLTREAPISEASWGVLVCEASTTAERTRHAYDVENRQQQIDVVDGFLGADDGQRALLRPNATYTVTVGYHVDVTGADGAGKPKDGDAVHCPSKEQSFRFKTAASPPERLDSWVLATDPGSAEEFVFYDDPLRIVFSTAATRKLFKAYDPTLDLYAVVRAASGNHPPATPAFDSAAATIPWVLTPFAAALGAVLSGQPCVGGGAVTGHERVTLELELEPLTEYLLDIQTHPSSPAPMYPLYRRRFATSRYATFDALAADVKQASKQASTQHRRMADVTALVALASADPAAASLQVPDAVFEQALRAGRWGELTRPRGPRVTVIWRDPPSPGQRSTPVAVLLESPEPLWRERDVPQEVSDAHGTRRFELRPQRWLEPAETPSGAAIATRLIHTTDGARTLVMLAPQVAVSGGALSLGLRRLRHPLLDGDSTIEVADLGSIAIPPRAPWEAGS